MEQLQQLDQVAYMRFASICRRVQYLSEFRKEIGRLESQSSKIPVN